MILTLIIAALIAIAALALAHYLDSWEDEQKALEEEWEEWPASPFDQEAPERWADVFGEKSA